MTEALELTTVSVKFGEPLLTAMDYAIEKGHAISRSDFVRNAVRDLLDKLERSA